MTAVIHLAVERNRVLGWDNKPCGLLELAAQLADRTQKNPTVQILLSGDQKARHTDVMRSLDGIRVAGIFRATLRLAPPLGPEMERILPRFDAVAIPLLAGLCVGQWTQDCHAHLRLPECHRQISNLRAERQRLQQQLRNSRSDLDWLRDR